MQNLRRSDSMGQKGRQSIDVDEENKFEKEKIYNAFEDIIDIDTKQFILELSCFANTQDIISRYDDWYEDDLKRGVIEDLFKQVVERIKIRREHLRAHRWIE